MSLGAGTAAKAPEQGKGAEALLITLSHSCYSGTGSLVMSKLALSAGSKTLMVSVHVCLCDTEVHVGRVLTITVSLTSVMS